MDDLTGLAADLAGRGGPVVWVLLALGAIAAALILWSVLRLLYLGAFSRAHVGPSLAAWAAGDLGGAEALVAGRRGVRARTARVAMRIRRDPDLTDATAREEITRLALAEMRAFRRWQGTLDLIAGLAPPIGLLGTVLGLIHAFRGLATGAAPSDPAALATGVWEALVTTALGLAVAILAGLAERGFRAVTDRVQADMEDIATRVFTHGPAQGGR